MQSVTIYGKIKIAMENLAILTTEKQVYRYRAWGNVISKTGILADANPFRYRGYYYDAETGFYYLQTRYYDPTIGRFINADDCELVAELSSIVGR